MAANGSQLTALARKASRGDENAFNEIYLLTRDRAYFVAYTITHDEQDALDILQEGYLKAWQKLRETKSPQICAAWLNQIIGNTAKNHVKKRRPLLFQPTEEDDGLLEMQSEQDSGYIPDSAMDTNETRRLIMEIIDDLPEDQRLCVLMRYYDDMEVYEIAAALELPYETIKSRLRYARRKITGGVEDLERKGTKLFGALPIPLLVWHLQNTVGETTQLFPPLILAGSATGVAASGFMTAVTLPKIVAGIAAVAVVAGSATVVMKILPNQRQPAKELPTVVIADEAAEAVNAPPDAFSFPTLPDFTQSQVDPYLYTQAISLDSARAAARPVTTNNGKTKTTSNASNANSSNFSESETEAAIAATTRTIPATTAVSSAVTTTAASSTVSTKATSPSEIISSLPTSTFATTTTSTAAATTTSSTTAPQLQRITKTSNGVILEYMSDILPEEIEFQVNQGLGFTTEIVNCIQGESVAGFRLACTLNGAPVHAVQGSVMIRLPVPAAHLPDIIQLEVQHRIGPGLMNTMPARAENGYLVFETNYI